MTKKITNPVSDKEKERLDALLGYNVMDTPPEEELDNITQLASYICQTPIAMISLIDENRQWFKSKIGLELEETSREFSFCHYTIMGDDLIEIPDAMESKIFSQNPLVKGYPDMRFYAGMPLTTPQGHNLGTLCVIDLKPKKLTQEQKTALSILAKQVMAHLDFRTRNFLLKQKNQKIISLIKTQQSIFDGASYSIIFTDIEGKIKKINKACLDLLQYTEEEVREINSPLIFLDQNELSHRATQLSEELEKPLRSTFEALVSKARLENIADANEWTFISKNGNKIPVWLSVTCIFDNESNGLGYLLVAEDYTSKKKAESELVEAKKIAEQAVAMKDNFLANMSHEIRTPLNAIIGFTDLLSDSSLDCHQKEYVENVKMAGENLMLIINDILDLSKIESGKLVIDNQPFDLKHTLKHVYNLLSVKAKEKQLEFNLYLDADLPDTISGDKGRLNQVLVNLAGNAIKFTREGEVVILVKKSKETDEQVTLEFSVKDTGIGISPDKLESIFERFSQGEESTTRNFGGTGLGLSICKQLIDLQNGKLFVNSTLGKGSKFYFSLEYKKVNHGHIFTETAMEAPTVKQKLSVLLCEDNPINQRLVQKVMQGFGYDLDIANNGMEGIELLGKKKYDLVLMDLEMPKKDGYQTTIYIRETLKSTIPIIAMTAHSLVGEKQNCYDIGMNGYVAKPFRQSDLLNQMHEVMMDSAKNAYQSAQKTLVNVDASFRVEKINLSYLKELSSGSSDFEIEMMEMFILRVATDMELLANAIQNKKFKTVKDLAHGLKSSLSLFQLHKSVEYLSQLEGEALSCLKNNKEEFGEEVLVGFEVLHNKLIDTSEYLNHLLQSDYSNLAS